MPWSTSNRKSELPSNWLQLRAMCMARANARCEARTDTAYQWEWPNPMWIGPDDRCVQTAVDVDHKGDPMDHSVHNLQGLCKYHHSVKTSRESAAGRAAMRKKLKMPQEKSPGLL